MHSDIGHRSERGGTSVFVWHQGKSRYDEVRWFPHAMTPVQAYRLARLRLHSDHSATLVQVEYDECGSVVEAKRR